MRWPSSWKAAGLAAFALLAFASTVNAVAVMSVDIGSEWMKVAVVSVSKTFILLVLPSVNLLRISFLHTGSEPRLIPDARGFIVLGGSFQDIKTGLYGTGTFCYFA